MNLCKEIELALAIAKHALDKRNVRLDIAVAFDGIKYMLVDLESLFILSPRYERFMWNYLTPHQNDVFVDVGAHIGKYSLQIAGVVGAQGKVIAIEPDPDNFEALLEGVEMNEFSNVVALPIAAFDRECTLPFYVSPSTGKTKEGWLIGKGWSSLKHRTSENVHEVVAKPLDKILKDLGVSHVDYIKIDVEGAEYEVLKGSREVIERNKPKIIAECTMKQNAVFRFMKEEKYTSILVAPNYYLFEPCDQDSNCLRERN